MSWVAPAATVKSTTVTLTAVDPIEISTQPIDRAIEEGNPVKPSWSLLGTGTLTYQWFYNGAELSVVRRNRSHISSVSTSNAGSYSGCFRRLQFTAVINGQTERHKPVAPCITLKSGGE